MTDTHNTTEDAVVTGVALSMFHGILLIIEAFDVTELHSEDYDATSSENYGVSLAGSDATIVPHRTESSESRVKTITNVATSGGSYDTDEKNT